MPEFRAYHGPMADLWVVLGTLAFFGLCVAFVHGCDRIIGPDEASDLEMSSESEPLATEVLR
jgi:hypothetical protein